MPPAISIKAADTLHEDILHSCAEALQKDPSGETKTLIAHTIGLYLKDGIFDSSERTIALDIIRILAKDINQEVRKTLATILSDSNILPLDVAIAMAEDVDSVSVPVLESSSILKDRDLINIIKTTNSAVKLFAIANRKNISPAIVNELLATRNAEIFTKLTARKVIQAEFILNALPTNKSIRNKKSAQKPPLPPTGKKGADPLLSKEDEVNYLVNKLFKEGQLTDSLILRSVCQGNLAFFEVSLAMRLNIPIANARILIRNSTQASFKSLWKRAKLPENSFDAMVVIISLTVNSLQSQNKSENLTDYLLGSIKAHGYDKNTTFMPYFMNLITSGIKIGDITHL